MALDEVALEREQAEKDRQARTARFAPQASPVMVLLVTLATAGILAYAWFLLRPGVRGDLLPYTLVIVAEGILVLQALFSMWTILAGGQNPRDYAYYATQQELFPVNSKPEALRISGREVSVDIFITCYGEDLAKIRATARAARDVLGKHRTYILDDGKSDEVRSMAASIGVDYIRRLSSGGAKAGNVNHALSVASGDFFVILDADFVPKPDLLVETLPFMVDDTVAFVQTPQQYGNLHTIIARGAAYMQAVFYRFVQPGRNRFNAAFCVGTNVLFRREAVDSVGGIYTQSKSEDVWTSLKLHELGWRSIYIPQVLAIGDAPETVEAFSKQQLRWAMGGFEILMHHFPLSPRRKLTMDQRLQYMVTASFYLTGICPLLLILVPPLEVYFDLRPISADMSIAQWGLFYGGFYILQILLAWFVMGSFRWETLTLATSSFPIYVKALWNVFIGRDVGWHVTGAGGEKKSPFNFMVPQLLFFAFLLLTTGVAIIRDLDNGVFTLATAWNALNSAILALFIGAAWREVHPSKRAERRRMQGDLDREITVDTGVLSLRPTTGGIPYERGATWIPDRGPVPMVAAPAAEQQPVAAPAAPQPVTDPRFVQGQPGRAPGRRRTDGGGQPVSGPPGQQQPGQPGQQQPGQPGQRRPAGPGAPVPPRTSSSRQSGQPMGQQQPGQASQPVRPQQPGQASQPVRPQQSAPLSQQGQPVRPQQPGQASQPVRPQQSAPLSQHGQLAPPPAPGQPGQHQRTPQGAPSSPPRDQRPPGAPYGGQQPPARPPAPRPQLPGQPGQPGQPGPRRQRRATEANPTHPGGQQAPGASPPDTTQVAERREQGTDDGSTS